MLCNFCGVPVPEGEGYCSKCAEKARSNRSAEEREAELSEIKTELRSQIKPSLAAKSIGKNEVMAIVIIMVIASLLAHLIHIFHLGLSDGGESLLDLGATIGICVLIGKRLILGRNIAILKCLILGVFLIYTLFQPNIDMLSGVIFGLVIFLNFFVALCLFRSDKIGVYFSQESS